MANLPGSRFDVFLTSWGNNKINAIKEARDLLSLGLKEAKELVESAPVLLKEDIDRAEADAIVRKFKKAGSTIEVRERAGADADPIPDGEAVDVFLAAVGPAKINVIKVVREQTGLGLRESKDLVESAPVVVRESVDKASAEALQRLLVAVGAQVELRRAGSSESAAGPAGEQYEVVLTGVGWNKIDVIRAIREITFCGLKDARDLVDGLPGTIKAGVTEDEAETIRRRLIEVGASAELRRTADAPSPGELAVFLRSHGLHKIAVIKAVREHLGLGLKDAKDLVESAPTMLKEGVTKEEAAAIQKSLVEAGATVEIR